jgi:hypothetical protein
VKLIYLDTALLKPTGFGKSEGPRADILRAIVVFLHSTFEDLMRSRARPYNKKFTFYSGADIDKILRRCQLDPNHFKPLYPPLIQMAKRRARIVHYADLPKQTDTAMAAWTIVDEWQLIMWMLAVMAFHSLLTSIDHDDKAACATYLKLREAMNGFVTFGKQLAAFADTPREPWIVSLRKISQTLDIVSGALVTAKQT